MTDTAVIFDLIGRDRTSAVVRDVGGAFSGLGGVIGKVTAGVGAGLAVFGGLQKAQDYVAGAIDAASNLNESVNAVQKVFGASSAQVLEWGKTNANAFGLSKRAFNEAITPLGAMLKNSGLAMKDVTKDTIDLTKRASDMASVFNTSVPDALEAIQAGIRGETDPLERYGVSLSAAKVEAEALAETHKHAASQLTATELATARVNLIMKQTASVQGDFTQTSDQLANSSRVLAARNEDLQAKIGTGLLPVMLLLNQAKLALVDVIGTKVLPKLQELETWFTAKVLPAVKDKLIPALHDLWSWFQDNVAPAIKHTADEASHLKGGFEDLGKSAGDLKTNIIKLWQQLGPTKDALKEIGGVSLGTLLAGLYQVSAQIRVINAELSLAISLYNKLGGTKGVGGAVLFGPLAGLLGRVSGGPVRSGQAYVVGEKRPEVFVPNEDGVIVPSLNALGQVAASGPTASAPSRTTVAFAGNTDSAFATAFMRLVREGIIQIEAA